MGDFSCLKTNRKQVASWKRIMSIGFKLKLMRHSLWRPRGYKNKMLKEKNFECYIWNAVCHFAKQFKNPKAIERCE
jgi:hypothetical protein